MVLISFQLRIHAAAAAQVNSKPGAKRGKKAGGKKKKDDAVGEPDDLDDDDRPQQDQEAEDAAGIYVSPQTLMIGIYLSAMPWSCMPCCRPSTPAEVKSIVCHNTASEHACAALRLQLQTRIKDTRLTCCSCCSLKQTCAVQLSASARFDTGSCVEVCFCLAVFTKPENCSL